LNIHGGLSIPWRQRRMAEISGQWSRASAGPTPAGAGASALNIRPVPSKRRRWRCLAASTRADGACSKEQVRRLTQALVGELFVRLSEPASTRGISMWMLSDPQSRIGAVQERAGDAANQERVRLVAADHRVAAGALMYLVTTQNTGFRCPSASCCQSRPEASMHGTGDHVR